METLQDSLCVARQSLPETLVAADAIARIDALARRLAPIHCAGFETRLGNDDTVDLIHRVRGSGGEPQRLGRYIRTSPLAESTVWRRLADFCELWSTPVSVLDRSLLATFLSFDAAAATEEAPTPSLYLSLDPGAGAEWTRLAEFVTAATRLLRGTPLATEAMNAARSCHEALPGGAVIADVGIMLSRPAEAVRLVVAHLRRDQITDYLGRLDWLGAAPAISPALDMIPAAIDHVIVSLDVGAKVFPVVGLEYCPGATEADVPKWAEAIAALVDAGHCRAVKGEALLGWPGHIEPTDSDVPWPAGLLVDSLLNRSDQFLVLARRLMFLKMVCRRDAGIEAKAYFGYGPRSFATAAEHTGGPDKIEDALASEGHPGPIAVTDRRTNARGATRTGAELATACDDAVATAVTYLIDQRGENGLWREFPRVLRGTDEWATAYIGSVLAATPRATAHREAESAWAALADLRPDEGGWGYNGDLPIDADSTIWGIRLAEALGRADAPRADAARLALRRHLLPSGGVATYARGCEPRLRDILGDADLSGMFVAHTCVTAAAATTGDLRNETIGYLIQQREVDGRWRGYWWSDDEYTTALASAALTHPSGDVADAESGLTKRWARARFDRDGVVWSRDLAAPSAFATALVVEILLTSATAPVADLPDAARTASRWLLNIQERNGAWPASALMRMPATWATDGDADPASTTVSVDDRALFTTATVVRVLNQIRKYL